MKRRILASILILCMLLVMLPVTAAAEEAEPVVELDGVGFTSIKDALWTLSSADTTTHTLKVVKDHEIDVNYSTYNYPILVNGFSIILDLNGKTITADWSKYTGNRVDNALIGVCNGGKLTVTDSIGGGKIVNNDTNQSVENRIFWVMNGTATKELILNIEDGTFIQNDNIHLLYIQGNSKISTDMPVTVNIKGGNFEINNYDDFFNAYDGFQYTATIIGGTFNKNPGNYEIVLAKGYEAVEEAGGKCTVQLDEDKNFVAKIGNDHYESLKEAFNAAQNGETVKLIADITYDEHDVVYAHGGATGFGNYDQYNPSIIYIGGTEGATPAENQPSNVNAVLDLNGHTITNNADAHLFLIMDNAKVTFTDSVGTGAVVGTNENYPVIWAVGSETLVTIENGEYTTASATGVVHVTHSGDLVITGGEFKTTADDASLLIMLNSRPFDNPNYFLKGVATVTISGGMFYGFNPEKVGDDYGASSIEDIKFVDGCAEGYASAEYNGVYGIVPEVEEGEAADYVNVTFVTAPFDTDIVVVGVKSGNYVPPVFDNGDGSFAVVEGEEYKYTVSATGYDEETGSFTTTDKKVIHVVLKDTPPLEDETIIGGLVDIILATDTTTATMMPEKDVLSFGDALDLYQMQLLAQSGSFSDVAKSDWFYSDVTALVSKGIISGYPDGSFRPYGEVTWGEALKLVMKAVGYGDIEATNGHWASGFMGMAIEKGLISGAVELDAAISRGEMADLTAKALKLGEATAESPFADEAPASAVALYEAGIVKGSLDDGQLLYRSESTIVRAEMAAIIWRVYCAR